MDSVTFKFCENQYSCCDKAYKVNKMVTLVKMSKLLPLQAPSHSARGIELGEIPGRFVLRYVQANRATYIPKGSCLSRM